MFLAYIFSVNPESSTVVVGFMVISSLDAFSDARELRTASITDSVGLGLMVLGGEVILSICLKISIHMSSLVTLCFTRNFLIR